MQFIGCDAHKRYSVFVAVNERGEASRPIRVEHERETFRTFLRTLPPHSDIAVESTGFWYWMVDAMDAAEHRPHLAQTLAAKQCMGRPNKSDPLDAKSLGILLRNGTLPECWIPPRALRDQRELLRTRMALRDLSTSLKHRIHAALQRYGLHPTRISDLFGQAGRAYLARHVAELPPETGRMVLVELAAIDDLRAQIDAVEQRIHEAIEPHAAVTLLKTLPGVGAILAPVIWLEIGAVARFPGAGHLASYAGLVPRLIASGGRVRHGRVGHAVNQYLKWAFVEAATCAVRTRAAQHAHIGQLYRRLRLTRGYGRAIVAVARHLAEASYWVLRRQQSYRAPRAQPVSSRPD